MNDSVNHQPKLYSEILNKSEEVGFNMPSDLLVGSLLKTLVSSKLKGRVLELGTGLGLSLSWILEGLDLDGEVISIDNNPDLVKIAKNFFKNDNRVDIICDDASQWIKNYSGEHFDLVFADAWPGKYSDLDATLNLIKTGGFYIIDDMVAQSNWPEGHQEKVNDLLAYLQQHQGINITKLNWSTGIVIAVKL